MKNIFKIFKVSRPLYKILGVIALLIVMGALLDLATPLVSKQIVDQIVAQTTGDGGNLNSLIFLIGLTFVFGLAGIIASAFSDRLGDHFAGELRKLLTENFTTGFLPYHKVILIVK
jgi:ABC-type multidrug transport system fused ATPase/permease subunit